MQETSDREIRKSVPNHDIGPRLGIIGGGQLARMTALAATNMGCHIVVIERFPQCPASGLASLSLVGDWNDPNELLRLASTVDVVTLENEFVDNAALQAVEKKGHLIFPKSETMLLIQDKLIQKETLLRAGLSVPRFRAVATVVELREASRQFGLPLVLKTRRDGYDGKGNFTIRTESDMEPGWQQLGGGTRPLYVEEFWPFVRELAVIITRGRNGETARYPVVETIQKDHICHMVKAPAEIQPDLAERAAMMAEKAVAAVGGIGSFGVEMFLAADGTLVINELAPRVHNSGHYTIEACACSQFENHVRAVLGWPLGSTEMVAPAAVMVNLLGQTKATGRARGIEQALSVSGAHLHLYGKAMSGPGRKMGHLTALGRTMDEAVSKATTAARFIHFGEPT